MQETIVERDCRVSAAEYFRTVLLSAVAELEASTGMTLEPSQLKEGYHYRREGKDGKEMVTFKRIRPNTEYAVKVARGSQNIQMRFELKATGEDTCHVKMTQTVMTNKKPDRISNAVMTHRMKKRLKDLEKGTADRLKKEKD